MVIGYKTAVRIFPAGRAGEDKIAQYFDCDCSADANKLSDPLFHETTRDNIAYCFADPAPMVKDISNWVSDWSPVLEAAKSAPKVMFIQGDLHTFYRVEDISAICAIGVI